MTSADMQTPAIAVRHSANKNMKKKMNRGFQGALAFIAVLCFCTAIPVYGQSSGNNDKNAEQRFNIQMIGALNNDPKAQFNVAQMYEQGVGIPQDLGMAKMWYTKSANQGFKPAVKKLASWEQEQTAIEKEAELQARQRAEEERRRQAEAVAAAVAKAQKEHAEEQKRRAAEAEAAAAAKAARQRAEEQKRRQAEAVAAKAAADKQADQKRRQAAEVKAAATRQRTEEQKRRQAEADAAAAKVAETTKAAMAAGDKKPVASQPKAKSGSASAETASKTPVFRANPCETPTAKFTSTCQ